MVGMEMATMVWSRAATKRASYRMGRMGKLGVRQEMVSEARKGGGRVT